MDYLTRDEELFENEISVPTPSFIKTEEVVAGARRGTLIHSVFEHLDYLKFQDEESIKVEIDRLILEKKLDVEVLSVVHPKSLAKMSQSSIIEKMRKAKSLRNLPQY